MSTCIVRIIWQWCKTKMASVCQPLSLWLNNTIPMRIGPLENAIAYQALFFQGKLTQAASSAEPGRGSSKQNYDGNVKEIPLQNARPGETESADHEDKFLNEWERDFH